MAMASKTWANRIVRSDVVDAASLIPNPLNFRTHPDVQRAAILGSMRELGWIQQVIVNQRTGRIIDGHLRVEEAVVAGEKVPVLYVDLDEAEEKLALSIIDPMSAMAGVDKERLDELLAQVQTDDAALASMIQTMVDEHLETPKEELDTSPQMDGREFRIMVECKNEAEQTSLLERFNEEGLNCKAIIS